MEEITNQKVKFKMIDKSNVSSVCEPRQETFR